MTYDLNCEKCHGTGRAYGNAFGEQPEQCECCYTAWWVNGVKLFQSDFEEIVRSLDISSQTRTSLLGSLKIFDFDNVERFLCNIKFDFKAFKENQ